MMQNKWEALKLWLEDVFWMVMLVAIAAVALWAAGGGLESWMKRGGM